MTIKNFLRNSSIIAVFAGGLMQPALAQDQDQRKDATEAANSILLKQLPFSDTSDFDDANKGLIAPLPPEMIKGQSGNAIWNPQQYGFITEGAPALNHTAGIKADDADATITLSHETLNKIVLQQTTIEDAIGKGDVKIDGDQAKPQQVVGSLDTFEFRFNIVTP